ACVADPRICPLNRDHLAHAAATDVVSVGFAPGDASRVVVGDVYIAREVARRNARDHGRGVREELMRLVVHGVLHVLGYEHPEDEARYASPMWRRQERLLRSLGAA